MILDQRRLVNEAPGSEQRKDRGLRLIALFKFFKATLLVAVFLGAIQLLNPAATTPVEQWTTAFTTSSCRRLLQHLLARVAVLAPSRLELVALGALLYAGLFTTEGVGLWRGRRWAEYLTVLATASFLPIEILELVHRLTVPRVTAVMVNLLVVAYLINRLRRSHPEGSSILV